MSTCFDALVEKPERGPLLRQLQHVDTSLNVSRCCTTAHLLYVEKKYPGLLLAVYNPCSTPPSTWRSAYHLRGRADR
jgi:hypothetical protein